MDAEQFKEQVAACRSKPSDADDPHNLGRLRRLARCYLQNSELNAPDTASVLLAALLEAEAKAARLAAQRYERETKPTKLLLLAGIITLVAGSVILYAPIEGRKDTWLTILFLGMGWFCCVTLPGLRRRLPRLQQALQELERATVGVCGSKGQAVPPSLLAVVAEQREIMRAMLRKGSYKDPFVEEADFLLDQEMTRQGSSGAGPDASQTSVF